MGLPGGDVMPVDLLVLGVLVLQCLQALGIRQTDAAMLGLPIIQRGFKNAVLSAQVFRLHPGLMLSLHRDDLHFR
jgi:hypothetical protein